VTKRGRFKATTEWTRTTIPAMSTLTMGRASTHSMPIILEQKGAHPEPSLGASALQGDADHCGGIREGIATAGRLPCSLRLLCTSTYMTRLISGRDNRSEGFSVVERGAQNLSLLLKTLFSCLYYRRKSALKAMNFFLKYVCRCLGLTTKTVRQQASKSNCVLNQYFRTL